jgi:F-type H+-transporting ATPase subunit delta
MSSKRIASRYAKSLLDLAKESNNLEVVFGDMQSLEKAVENRDLYLMLKSPIINTKKKKDIATKIFGASFDKMSSAFIDLIIAKGREAYLPEIATEFVAQYNAYKSISSATLTSATPLTEAALASIKAKLMESNITNETVDITTKVDPNILGGFIIEIGDKLYDASVAHKLETLKKQFAG